MNRSSIINTSFQEEARWRSAQRAKFGNRQGWLSAKRMALIVVALFIGVGGLAIFLACYGMFLQ